MFRAQKYLKSGIAQKKNSAFLAYAFQIPRQIFEKEDNVSDYLAAKFTKKNLATKDI